MFQPNPAQWRVIWIGTVVVIACWVFGGRVDGAATRLGFAAIAVTALGVWRLAQ